ncbi:hypothetical protein [Cupriavidus sp. 8B]
MPARSALALQKFRSEAASVAPPAMAVPSGQPGQPAQGAAAYAPARPAAGPQGRQLTGAELASHFTHLGRINAIAPSGITLWMQVRESGGLDVTNSVTRGYSPGSYRIEPEANQICFEMANPTFSAMQTCYRLTEADGRFVMRSATSPYYFSYTK